MSATRANTRCRQGLGTPTACNRPFHEHGAGRACPDDSGRRFRKLEGKGRAGTSFNAAEVELLDQIRKGLVHRGRDLSHLTRHPAFNALANKVSAMRASLGAGKSDDEAAE